MPEISRSQLVAYAPRGARSPSCWRALPAGPGARSPTAPARRRAAPRRRRPPVRVERGARRVALVHVAGAVRARACTGCRGARVQDAVAPRGRAAPGATSTRSTWRRRSPTAAGRRARRGAARRPRPRRAAGAPAGGPPAGPINLNTATAEQLETLDGIGPATASKILDWRRSTAAFVVDDLGQVPGIGPKRLAALRAQVQP